MSAQATPPAHGRERVVDDGVTINCETFCDGLANRNRMRDTSLFNPADIRAMYSVTESVTVGRDRSPIVWARVSRDRPRTIILYALFCLACLVVPLALADIAVVILFR
jgi:hypothetical protein